MIQRKYLRVLNKYGQMGVELLAANTPVDTGLTASSWYYEIEETDNGTSIIWKNSNEKNGWANIALLLQYGHATGTGGYVRGIDYINPALQPVFDKLAETAWKEVQDS
jgi:hypothetical protein